MIPTSQSSVNDDNSDGDKLPAALADIGLLAASPDIIVVCHVYVKHQFLLAGSEAGLLHTVFHARLCTW